MSNQKLTLSHEYAKHPLLTWRVLFPLLIIAAGLVAYYNSFAGVFLFDDRLHILGDRRLKMLWPLWEALGRRRPVVDYSLAANYAVSGQSAWGFHVVNVTIHILAALTLFGIVRRTLSREPLRRRFGPAAWSCALVIGLIWVVHPLQTQSVTYLIQRAECLMGLFYLLTLYCVIRGADSSRGAFWYAASVLFCALGMGSKAVMVTAPVVVLICDRVFLSRTWGEALRRRWVLYVGLVATWAVLWFSGVAEGVLNPSRRGGHVGFSYRGITPLGYALTQCGVLLQYLKLSFFPYPLCLDYDWPTARTVGQILPQGVAIVTLLAVTVWALVKRPQLGFVGAWFFIVLAPTSSFVPIRDPLFEHRMYLSLAAVVVLAVIGVDWILRRVTSRAGCGDAFRRTVAGALVVMVVASLTYGTVRRNRVYHSESAMWRDVLTKYPRSARAAENLGFALLAEEKLDEALRTLQEAVRISPRSANVHHGLGFTLVAHGRLDEAIEEFREAVRLNPRFPRAYVNLGNAMNDKGRVEEALEYFATAVRLRPNYTDARLNLGNALLAQGRVDEAIEQYVLITEFDPRHAKGWSNLGYAFLSKAQTIAASPTVQFDQASLDGAVTALRRALDIDPESHNAYNSLALALVTQAAADKENNKPDEAKKRFNEAIDAFRQALWVKPDFTAAHYNLANALVERGDEAGAVRHYMETLKIEPNHVNARFNLAMLLWKNGELDEALLQFEQILEIAPDERDARRALEAIREEKARQPAD